MGQEEASLFEDYPSGYPAVVAAGRALNLRLFVPAIYGPKFHKDGDTHFKERVRGRTLPVSPKCDACGQHKTRVQFYSPERTILWEEWVGTHVLNQLRRLHTPGQDFTLPIENARILTVVRFNFRKPSSYPKSVVHHVVKPDADNAVKAIYDALTKYKVWKDDALITDESVRKRYVEPGHPAGVEVDVTAIGL